MRTLTLSLFLAGIAGEEARLLGKVILWVLALLGIDSLGSFFAVVVAFFVGALITVIPGYAIAALLIFIAIRGGRSIFGASVKSNKFIPFVNTIIIATPW